MTPKQIFAAIILLLLPFTIGFIAEYRASRKNKRNKLLHAEQERSIFGNAYDVKILLYDGATLRYVHLFDLKDPEQWIEKYGYFIVTHEKAKYTMIIQTNYYGQNIQLSKSEFSDYGIPNERLQKFQRLAQRSSIPKPSICLDIHGGTLLITESSEDRKARRKESLDRVKNDIEYQYGEYDINEPHKYFIDAFVEWFDFESRPSTAWIETRNKQLTNTKKNQA